MAAIVAARLLFHVALVAAHRAIGVEPRPFFEFIKWGEYRADVAPSCIRGYEGGAYLAAIARFTSDVLLSSKTVQRLSYQENLSHR